LAVRLVDRGARIIVRAVDGLTVLDIGGGVAAEVIRPQ
jgi:hypothetical protein